MSFAAAHNARILELVPLPPNSLRIGQAVPFSVRNAEGQLLIASGQVLQDGALAQELISRGAWVLAHETLAYQKALARKVDSLLHQGVALNEIARAQVDLKAERPVPKPELGEHAAWADLQSRAHGLLREPRAEDFLARFDPIRDEALSRLQQRPESSLMLLLFECSQDFQNYSAKHGLLSLLLAELSARQLGWSDEWRLALGQAALSMNLSISLQQERLAAQADAATPSQREALKAHGERAAELLSAFGVRSDLWLGAVRLHHDAGPGPLTGRPPEEALARLLRRIDIFGARLSPRRSRNAQSGAAAARAVYLDETGKPDEAGAALIKTIGLYPPGSLVRLANGEVGIVFKRGFSATEPMVAALLGKSGSPLSEPVPRDTRLATQAVAGAMAPHELKLRVNVEKLLRLYQL